MGKRISELILGDIFNVKGNDFIVLEHKKEGTLIMCKSIFPLPVNFDCKSSNWEKSELRTYLKGTILANFQLNFGEENIVETESDLSDNLKNRNFKNCKDKIRLLTLLEYEKYHQWIPRQKNVEWLITPYYNHDNNCVCCLYENKIDYQESNAKNVYCRPVLTIKSTTIIPYSSFEYENAINLANKLLSDDDLMYTTGIVGAMDILIDAAKLQTKMNVIRERTDYLLTDNTREIIYRCRNCNKQLKENDYFCSECGQAIDWKE